MTKSEDTEYQDHIIQKVEPSADDKGWAITFDGGMGFWVPNNGVVPTVGATVRFYGRGLGCPVRGLDIDGQEVFYRTPEQQEEYHKQQVEEMNEQRKKDFAKSQSRLDLDYDSLPRPFQKRIDRFRAYRPDWRWQHEAYEMSVCKDAVRIAATCQTEEGVSEFYALSWDEQKERIPDMFDGHSGNSFGAACHLARLYLHDSKLVEIAHGALCPLVGCKDYGCYAATQPAPLATSTARVDGDTQ
jgi:hypothetical protein